MQNQTLRATGLVQKAGTNAPQYVSSLEASRQRCLLVSQGRSRRLARARWQARREAELGDQGPIDRAPSQSSAIWRIGAAPAPRIAWRRVDWWSTKRANWFSPRRLVLRSSVPA